MNARKSTLVWLLALGAPMAQAYVRVDLSDWGGGGFVSVIGTGEELAVSASLPPPSQPQHGTASGAADSAFGKLRAAGGSPPELGDTVSAGGRMYDFLTFTVTGAPATIVFRGFLKGSITGLIGPLAGVNASLQLRAEAPGSVVEDTGTLIGPTSDPAYCNPPILEGSFCMQGVSVARSIALSIELPVGTSGFGFSATLGGGATRGGSFDFSNTASVWIELPAGVTLSPSTEGFLAQAAPVPEPATTVLWFSGLAALAAAARRRR